MPSTINFNSLWNKMVQELTRIGDVKTKNVFLNNAHQKEYICRHFNVISEADVIREISKAEKNMA
jgi:hypothetical protein